MENEKKNRCIIFFMFQLLEQMKKNIIIIIIMKKNCAESVGLLPNCVVKKKKIVLQDWYCIAIEVGWLLGDLKIVLQYNYCIAEKKA